MNAITLQDKAVAKVNWRDLLKDVEDRIEKAGRECDKTGAFVSENLDLLESLGFFALGVPSDLGGGGASYLEVAEALRARQAGWLDGARAVHAHAPGDGGRVEAPRAVRANRRASAESRR